jgi:hypothetical protein
VLAEWLERQALADEKRGQPALAAAARAEAVWAREQVRRLHDEFLAADPAGLVRRGLALVGFSVAPAAP